MRLYKFAYINLFIFLLTHISESFVINGFKEIFKSISITVMMVYYTRSKKVEYRKNRIEHLMLFYYWIITCFIKDITEYLITTNFSGSIDIYFPIMLFLYELIFDIFHYIIHLYFHIYNISYHKVHHSINIPSIYETYYIHPIDLFCSYIIPIVLTSYIFMYFQWNINFPLTSTYLTYQELGGHLGKKMRPTSCFPIYVSFPKIFNIELYTEDHTYHHILYKYNYGKRFSFMDKLFGTYKY